MLVVVFMAFCSSEGKEGHIPGACLNENNREQLEPLFSSPPCSCALFHSLASFTFNQFFIFSLLSFPSITFLFLFFTALLSSITPSFPPCQHTWYQGWISLLEERQKWLHPSTMFLSSWAVCKWLSEESEREKWTGWAALMDRWSTSLQNRINDYGGLIFYYCL